MDEVSKSERREIDRVMFDEILEKDKYPQVEYKSSRVQVSGNSKNTYRMDRDLKLHGLTRSMELNAQILPLKILFGRRVLFPPAVRLWSTAFIGT